MAFRNSKSEMVARRLRHLRLSAGMVSAGLVDARKVWITGRTHFDQPVQNGSVITRAVKAIFLRQGVDVSRCSIYRLGVTAHGLSAAATGDDLFGSGPSKRLQLDVAMDKINAKYGSGHEWERLQTRSSLGDVPRHSSGEALLPCRAFFAGGIIRDSVGFGRLRER